jgi:hypothetical protein
MDGQFGREKRRSSGAYGTVSKTIPWRMIPMDKASEQITCSDDCGSSHMEFVTGLEGQETNRVWVWSDAVVAAMYDGTWPFPRSGYCPKCGRRLSFTPEGAPVIGESYAELEIDARRMRKLDADGPTIDGYGGAYYTHHGEFAKLSDLADALAEVLPVAPDNTRKEG